MRTMNRGLAARWPSVLAACAAGLLMACTPGAVPGDTGTPPDGLTDAGHTDAGTRDAGHVDAGVPDAGPADAGVPDAGTRDAGPADAGQNAPRTCADEPCFAGVTCTDTPDGASCGPCPDGFVGDGFSCTDGTTTPAAVYAMVCAGCHGADGQGGAASALTGTYTRDALTAHVASMPPGSAGPDCGGASPCISGMVDYLFDAFATEEAGGGGTGNTSGFAGATLLSPAQTLRKATLLFARRLPTAAELDGLTEANLATRLRAVMHGPAFTAFLMDGANDLLLTRQFVDGPPTARALQVFKTTFDDYHYFQANSILNARIVAAQQAVRDANYAPAAVAFARNVTHQTNRAFAEQPLRLIAHVVQNERPYTEVLTARYAMMNPYLDDALQGRVTFTDDADPEEWREGHIYGYQLTRRYPGNGTADDVMDATDYGYLPTSGVLSSPAFLMRYPSTETNKQRARSRAVYQLFLGIDIEELTARSQDDVMAVSNPQTLGTSCRGCHELMDPVAGAYQNWGHRATFLPRSTLRYADGQRFRHALARAHVYTEAGAFQPNYTFGNRWYRIDPAIDILPGYHDGTSIVPMPTVAAYQDIDRTTGYQDGVQWLADQLAADPRFGLATVKFWSKAVYGIYPAHPSLAVQTELSRLATDFWAHKNLKDLLVQMSLSPLFRLRAVDAAQHPMGTAHLDAAGVGRVSTPEFFAAKFKAITGHDADVAFLEDYYYFLGGIDSDGIVERPEAFNTILAAGYERIAATSACGIVAADFARPDAQRLLFGGLLSADAPGTPAVDTRLKAALVRLQFRVLGTEASPADAETTALFDLFVAAHAQHVSQPPAADVACAPASAAEAAWTTVMLYLLGDPLFLAE